MAWTDNSSLTVVLTQAGINTMLDNLRDQRPSLFNYATPWFIANPQYLCKQILADPAVITRQNPLIHEERRWPIPGTDGMYGLDFCLQITSLRLDLHPLNTMTLPPEMPTLPAQRIAVQAGICVGIGCPSVTLQEAAGNDVANAKQTKQADQPANPPAIQANHVECFCLEVFGIAHVDTVDPRTDPKLAYRLDQLEIVDITPTELENTLECFLSLVLRVGVLPKMRQSLDTLLLQIPSVANLEIELSPIDSAHPFNPAVQNNQLIFYVDVRIS